ncbi:hypothetical protein EBU91_03405 [bacterium]|nr:hypothetical protein [bacterium]
METFAYQKLIRELDEKIKIIADSEPRRNSKDSINLIKLRLMKKNAESKYKEQIGGSLKSVFKVPNQ